MANQRRLFRLETERQLRAKRLGANVGQEPLAPFDPHVPSERMRRFSIPTRVDHEIQPPSAGLLDVGPYGVEVVAAGHDDARTRPAPRTGCAPQPAPEAPAQSR